MAVTKEIAKKIALIHKHPKYFIKYATYTRDPNDSVTPKKKFPYHLEFHQRQCELWWNHRKFVDLKSRQMQVSWLMLALHLWLAMTGANRDIYIRRQKWADALLLLDRMQFIYDNIPEDVWPSELRPRMTTKEGIINFPDLGSKVLAMASGKDQGRGETPTALLIDEFAFQEDDEITYQTMAPALQGDSRVTLISTPCPLFGERDPYHRRVIEDRTGVGYEDYAKKHNKELAKLPKLIGYKEWINPGNGFACTELHYTADPSKRSKEWKTRLKSQMTEKAWLTEFELSWETYSGEPVFGSEFSKQLHVMEKRYEPDPDHPILLRGWDFGGNHSCVVTQYVDNRLIVIDEFANMGYNTRVIAAEVQARCKMLYGDNFVYKEIIDPSGMWEGKTSDGKACADVMRELGMELIPGVQDPTRRIDAVMKLLIGLSKGKPQLMLNPTCSMLIKGFQGGYHYPEKLTKNQKFNRPEKNEFSHIMDGLEYVCTKISDLNIMFSYQDIDISALGGGGYAI